MEKWDFFYLAVHRDQKILQYNAGAKNIWKERPVAIVYFIGEFLTDVNKEMFRKPLLTENLWRKRDGEGGEGELKGELKFICKEAKYLNK